MTNCVQLFLIDLRTSCVNSDGIAKRVGISTRIELVACNEAESDSLRHLIL